MNTAENIVAKFGGQTAVASLIGKRQSTVAYWIKAGMIPSKWHSVLLDLARTHSLPLTSADFIPIDVTPDPASIVPENEREPSIIPAERPLPSAKWQGFLAFGEVEVSCYVLDNGERLISRAGATEVLTNNQGGGNLESYIYVNALEKHMPTELSGQLIEFNLEHVVNRTVRGMSAETFLDICTAYVSAFRDGALATERQKEIALQAAFVLASCSKVGLIALIDEATGYQYEREEDALQIKLRLFLAEEMRKWEKTFPDELWKEFGRLTNWKGNAHQRPKYWGKLVNELVYNYLDPDVYEWLKANVPKPRHGRNYHLWLSEQYGLKKLVEHLWMLVGMGSACRNMAELRRRMAEKYGKQPVQLTLYLDMPNDYQTGNDLKPRRKPRPQDSEADAPTGDNPILP